MLRSVVALAIVAACASFDAPVVDLDALDGAQARQALASVGALAVRVEGLAAARAAAFEGLDACLAAAPAAREIALADGRTRRSAGAGFENGVPREDLAPCGGRAAPLRAAVLAASRGVAAALDGGPTGFGGALKRDAARAPAYRTLAAVLDGGQHLEHLHAYYGAGAPAAAPALAAHVDGGVFVAMVAGDGAAALTLELPNGEAAPLKWDAASCVLVLAGGGADWFDWGGAAPALKPAAHGLALGLGAGASRAWYGLMVLPPNDALVAGRRYDAFRAGAGAAVAAGDGAGCGQSGRRLASPDAESCETQDGESGVMCWLQCMAVSCGDAEAAACVDGDTLEVVAGDEHCPNHGACEPVCLDVDGAVPANFTAKNDGGGFCVGDGQDMHMDGFRSSFEKHAPACVNLYVTDWTLNSAGKYAAGALAAFSVGLAVEALSRYRKKLYAARAAAASKTQFAALLVAAHFLQVVLGYLAMFAAMTYAVELFAAVCVGATAGYALFHLDAEPGPTDPCCQAQTLELAAAPENHDRLGDKGNAAAAVAPDEPAPCCCDDFGLEEA